ncbi:DUF1885 family protein [Alkalihalobacterium bogoriense]|uniref:DUF1885 family protein n=1 Tax=Alkalihalobacterium bogoriense TaxID=246272 RepID=UPI00047AF8CA|nr:DUF1885 family protein [Alkalihalobacterium bogoriense]
MSNHAFIKLVSRSKQQTITLDELKDIFTYYKTITSKTGDQLAWGYGQAAFPYEITPSPDGDEHWFYLKGTVPGYKYIVLGVGTEQTDTDSQTAYIQVTLPEGATHGDKGKANEFVKFLGKKLEAEVQLFNERTMYFYKR